MTIPAPEPGLVINYAYLWHHEHRAGREEGRKDRPSVVVLCATEPETGTTVVTVLPITHLAPKVNGEGVEIPPAVKRHLGLDDEPSWILVSEGNEFVWPGYDLRRRRKDGSYTYGFLPPRLFQRVLKAFVDWHNAHGGRRVPRD
jgi:hypothetical protein